MSDPNSGELSPGPTAPAASPATGAPASSAPSPAARTSGPGQAEKDAAGVPRWNAPKDHAAERESFAARERARLGHAPADPAAAPAKPDPAAAAAPADGAADAIKVGDVTVTSQEMKDFLARKAERESGRLQAFDSPEKYKAELSKEFKAPQGIDFAIDQNDPALPLLKNWAHKNQIPQSALSEVLDVYAGTIVRQQAIGKAAYEAEVAKMGAAGPGRIDALEMWLRGQIGDKAKILSGTRGPNGVSKNGVLWTAGIVEAFEALQQKFTGGGSHYTGNARDNGASDPGKIPGYANMSFEQRRQAQEQRRGR